MTEDAGHDLDGDTLGKHDRDHLDRSGIREHHDVDVAPALSLSECPTQYRAGEPL